MLRKDFYLVGFLWLLMLLIFLPLFYSDFIFMDEALQIWGYNADPKFFMLIDEGRFLTEWLERWLFEMIDSFSEVKYLRMVSLFGWMLCLPLWYAVIKREVDNVPHYKYLPFFTCLYLVTNPSFLVSVQWATCLQFFISDTASLLAGAIVINSVRSGEIKIPKIITVALAAMLLGVPAMFLYQGSWACFLIPFLLHFINPVNNQKNKVLIAGVMVHFFVYAAYFVAYKISFRLFGIAEDPRNVVYINPVEKIAFFLARPLERSFRFTLLTEERSNISLVYYALMLLSLAALTFKRFGKGKIKETAKYLAVIGGIWVLSYLPALMIQERFASNRTMLALNLCVFIVCIEMALFYIRNTRFLQIAGLAILLFFVVCARFNFHQGYARPLVDETAAYKNYFRQHFNKNIKTVHFVRPPGNIMAEKYNINESMDEFGVAGSFFEWVPDPFTRQLVYETTGDRQLASGIIVKQWKDKAEYMKSGEMVDSTVLLVDGKAIIDAITP